MPPAPRHATPDAPPVVIDIVDEPPPTEPGASGVQSTAAMRKVVEQDMPVGLFHPRPKNGKTVWHPGERDPAPGYVPFHDRHGYLFVWDTVCLTWTCSDPNILANYRDFYKMVDERGPLTRA